MRSKGSGGNNEARARCDCPIGRWRPPYLGPAFEPFNVSALDRKH